MTKAPLLAAAALLLAGCGSTGRAPVDYQLVVRGTTMAPANPTAFAGQEVTLTFITDVDEAIVLRTYDLRFACVAARPCGHTFIAGHTGNFDIVLETGGATLGTFSVSP